MLYSDVIIITMSVDVFGRKLERTEGNRGPPGVGYKITSDGQYDIDSKRLCNLAQPQDESDAVNLSTLKKLLQLKIELVRRELKDLDEIVEKHRDELDEKLIKVNKDYISLKEVMRSNGELIKTLISKVKASKNNGTPKSS